MALKFLGPSGGGMTSDAIACIDYMLEMKKRGANVRVVNCSWGSTTPSIALGDAIARANKQGILFVCAAGVRSQTAARIAAGIGLTKIYSLTGGTRAWVKVGLPLVNDLSVAV